MCQLKSGLVLKNRVFVPEYDKHYEMLKELGIEDNAINAMKTFVRFELSPSDGDVFSDIDTWKLRIDQDIIPDWWDEEEYKPKIVEAVKEWASEHIHINEKDLELSEGAHYVRNSSVGSFENSVVYAYDNSTIEAYDSSTVVAWGNSTVTAYDSSTVKARNNSSAVALNDSKVEAYDNSSVRAYDSSTVNAYSDSKVVAYDCSIVRAYSNSNIVAHDWSVVISKFRPDCLNITLFNNAIHKDNYNKRIYQSGNWGTIKV